MEAGVKELSRSNGVSECLAYAWDYETNYRDVRTFTVRHWRDTREGGYALKDERDIYERLLTTAHAANAPAFSRSLMVTSWRLRFRSARPRRRPRSM